MNTKLLWIATFAYSLGFAQTYQNSTATTAADAINRAGNCGILTQPGVNVSQIDIPITGTISDPTKVTFNLSLKSAWIGDIAIDLVSPSGDVVTLIRRIGTVAVPGNCNSNGGQLIPANTLSFNSANTVLISPTSGQVVPAGNYKPTAGNAAYPQHNMVDMSTFLPGKQVNGKWTLIIYDYGVDDLSNINSWQIILNSGALLRTNESGIFTSEILVKENPVKENLMLKLNNNDFKSLGLEIYDNSGKLIKKENIPNQAQDFQMDVSNWTPGSYLLIPVKDGERKQAIKLIKK